MCVDAAQIGYFESSFHFGLMVGWEIRTSREILLFQQARDPIGPSISAEILKFTLGFFLAQAS